MSLATATKGSGRRISASVSSEQPPARDKPAYLDGAGIAGDAKGPLFRTIGRGTRTLTRTPLPQANAYAMVRRRAAAAGIDTKIGNHSFRATGITAYLKNGGTLENAAAMANHASTRTTQLYDRRQTRSVSMRSSGSRCSATTPPVSESFGWREAMAQARGKPISLRAWPNRSLQASLAGILRFPPHRLVHNLLGGEFDRIPEDQIANI